MCFSARASFIASGGLLVTGVATLLKTTTTNGTMLATIPLVYSAHQLTEGLLWLTGPGSRWPTMNALASYAFLVVALIVWPVYMPLAVYLTESQPGLRAVLLAMAALGCLLGVYMAYTITRQKLPSLALYNHIVYASSIVESRAQYVGVRATYLLLVVLPFLISSHGRLRLYGLGLAATFAVAAWIYRESLTSVWCFFSALLSVALLFML